MANGLYDGTLASIPGLGGYLQQKQLNEQQTGQDLQHAAGAMSLLGQIHAQQEEQRLKALLQQSGGDFTKAAQAAAQSGNVVAALKLAQAGKAQRDAQNPDMTGAPDIVKLTTYRDRALAAGNKALADTIDAQIKKNTSTENSAGQEDRNFLLDVQQRTKAGQPVSPQDMGKAMMIYKNLSAPRFDAATGQQSKTDYGAEFDPSRNFGATVKGDFQSEEAAKNFALDAADRGMNVAVRGPAAGAAPTQPAPTMPPAQPQTVVTQVTTGKPTTALGKLNEDLKQGRITQAQFDTTATAVTKASDDVVKLIAEGRMQMPSGFALRSPYWQDAIERAAKLNPNLDATQYGVRAATRKAFATGPEARNVTALNTVIGHLGTLDEAATALDNGDIRAANYVFNRIGYELGDPKVVNFGTAKEAVAEETMRVFRQVGASEQEAKRWGELINSSNSPKQMRANIATLGTLLDSRVNAIAAQYDRATGTNPAAVDPANRTNLDRLKNGGAAPGKVKFLGFE